MKNIIILLSILLFCKCKDSNKNEALNSKESIVEIEVKNKKSLSKIIEGMAIDNLPIGQKSILTFTKPISIIPNEENQKYLDIIYNINGAYNYPKRYNNNLHFNPKVLENIYGLRHYDVEVNTSEIKLSDTLAMIPNKLPNKFNFNILLSQLNIIPISKKNGNDVLNIYSYDAKQNKIIDGLNIFYNVNLSYNRDKALYKDFTTGFVNKFFYIEKNYIISLLYIDAIYQGEGEEYKILRKEQWQIKPNGKFVRYYKKDGTFKNEEEQGEIKNSMRQGKWIETKPNGFINKKTYLKAEFKEGEPIGEWKFYSYEKNKKGKLLYTETYKNGKLQKRTFIEQYVSFPQNRTV